MTKVFIGGSRRVTRLNAEVRRRIDRMIEQQLPIVIGDANGADKAVQRYLHSRLYDHVEVFCTDGNCRNNLGQWPIRPVSSNGLRRRFDFYSMKDRVMAEEASVGLMIWDGKSIGTIANVFRMISRGKKVVLYVSPTKSFLDIVDRDGWDRFLSHRDSEFRKRIEKLASSEGRRAKEVKQIGLL